MARYECVRCNEICFTTSPEHICKDIRKRLERREKQIRAVIGILNITYPNTKYYHQTLAEEIVIVLANMGVDND